MNRAYYSAELHEFIHADPDNIFGLLAANHHFDLEALQKYAWMAQIRVLQQQLAIFREGHILLEYSIPRMGKRVDTVFLSHGIVFVIEFKVGESHYSPYALDQALDYALDLKNFHEQSLDKQILPVVVATEAPAVENTLLPFEDKVFAPLKANKDNLGLVLMQAIDLFSGPAINATSWGDSMYRPTPTIIEAAQALYADHSVSEISRSDSGAINLSLTGDAISSIINTSRMQCQKSICFVTGVPGAGKTLAGLNIATQWLDVGQKNFAVFLSGNGPLVTVLQEALARDGHARSRVSGKRQTKSDSLRDSKAFIQNVHRFRDDALTTDRPPVERVTVFDEAQRAWTRDQTVSFMKRKRGDPTFDMSEPEFLISIMDRHPDWAVIVCLVGGGQEINTGEAGLLEWLQSIQAHYAHWQVYCSPNLADDEYLGGAAITQFVDADHLKIDARLHLAISLRSFRAETVSGLVKAMLDNDIKMAAALCQVSKEHYPIVLTRDIDKAKDWLRTKARGSERYGLLANSGAIRLRPVGIDVKAELDVVNWFLSGKEDVRSSYYLEQAATEFDIQGLELDWTCVVWDADLRYKDNQWTYQSFQGTQWKGVHTIERRRYLKNAYRVLLTRARQGMVIVVPEGNTEDKTRVPEFYDQTYDFLKQIGFATI